MEHQISYIQGNTPSDAFEKWKDEWVPPETEMRIKRGRVLLEFGPKATFGTIFEADHGCSYSAIIIADPSGELQTGDEVALEGETAQQFRLEDRLLAIVKKSEILLVVEK